MRIAPFLVASLLALALSLVAGCEHEHDPAGYATLQACFDVHTGEESLTVNEAIVVCCLDHAIGGQTEVCKTTLAECITYVSTALADGSATAAEIDASCMSYLTERAL